MHAVHNKHYKQPPDNVCNIELNRLKCFANNAKEFQNYPSMSILNIIKEIHNKVGSLLHKTNFMGCRFFQTIDVKIENLN
jgi:hypothetical protein